MSRVRWCLWVFVFLAVMLPSAAYAQASITGVVKDASGAVLPGVTVEAASPALIEKARTAVTDGAGHYSIENLRPGMYTVTFTLTGFNTVRRDGVELSGSFSATINADMRLGALEETVTVTGEAPVVDTQSTTKERVMNAELINATPTGRVYSDLGNLVPGVKAQSGTAGTNNAGGALGDSQVNLQIHGSKAGDMRLTQNGVPLATLQSNGSLGIATPNVGAMQEVTMDTSAVSAELSTGGPRINMIPRDGGNSFKGTVYVAGSHGNLQGDNFTQRLKDLGLKSSSDKINKNGDINPGFGGPIRRDSVWFYATVRALVADLYPSGISPNLNANNPNAWTYVPDTSKKAENNALWTDGQIRLTWQANQKLKLAGTWDQQTRCSCPYYAGTQVGGSTRSPEAGGDRRSPTQRFLHAEAFSPLTNRLLVEFVGLHRTERWMTVPPEGLLTNPYLTGVLEQSNNLQYRGGGQGSGTYNNNWLANYALRAAVSYITGSHSFKAGWNDVFGYAQPTTYNYSPFFYRFNNGVPTQFTMYATPYTPLADEDADMGFFAQDRWKLSKFTISGGIRFDYFASSFPEQNIGPGLLLPTRDITFPKQKNLNFKDITPRLGLVYDVNGDGRTAVKVSLNKYLQGLALNGLGSDPNPINSLALTTNRSWNDRFFGANDARSGNFQPDCDLLLPTANGECGAMSNANFGKTQPTATFDPDLLTGWNHRFSNWEFSTGVQREILPRLSVDVSYFRRWFSNFRVTDNILVGASDYTQYSIVAPVDARLPNGGGYVVDGLYDLNPSAVGRVQNYNTLSDKFGKQTDHFNGMDFTVNARMTNGLILQGGLSTGKETTDNCDIVGQLPEMLLGMPTTSSNGAVTTAGVLQPQSYCHMEEPWLNDFRMQGIYRIPKIDVQIAANFSSVPGPVILSNLTVPTAQAALTLGRPLSGNAANVQVNIVRPGEMYVERLNNLDMRFSKILNFGKTRTSVGVDLYNALNVDTVTLQNNSYASWFVPQQVQYARFLKFSATFDF